MENIDKQSLELIDKIECFARIFVQSAKSFHNGSDVEEFNINVLYASYNKLDDALYKYQAINDHFGDIIATVDNSISIEELLKICKEKTK